MDQDSKEEGYDYKFVPSLNDKYACPICLSALREPHQTSCGHRFCRSCILKWIRASNPRCPVDNASISEKDIYPDNFAKREVLELSVCCPNSEFGCEFICELRDIKKHEDICGFARIPCPNSCGLLVFKKELDHHLQQTCDRRLVTCEHCSQPVEAASLLAHSDECPAVKTSCQHCHTTLARFELMQHYKEDCPMVTVPCLFAQLGCKDEMKRNEVDQHMETCLPFHLKLTGQAVKFLLQQFDRSPLGMPSTSHVLEDEVYDDVTPSLQTLRYQSRSLDRLPSCVKRLSQSDSETSTKASSLPRRFVNQLSPPPTAASAAVVAGNYDVERSSVAPFTNEPTSPKHSVKSKVEQSVVLSKYVSKPGEEDLLSQPGLESRTQGQARGGNLQTLQCSSCTHVKSELTEKISKLEYVLEEEKMVNKKLRESIKDMESRFTCGIKIWPIHNFSRIRREAEHGQTTVLHSDGFYTSYYGYKICLRINVNGFETSHGTHLSLFIHLMKGEFDDLLDWPFCGKIILSVLDQNESVEHRRHVTESLYSKPIAAFQKPVTNRNHKGFGYMEFVPLSLIDNSTYIKNDVLLIKAVVTVSTDSG